MKPDGLAILDPESHHSAHLAGDGIKSAAYCAILHKIDFDRARNKAKIEQQPPSDLCKARINVPL